MNILDLTTATPFRSQIVRFPIATAPIIVI